MTSLSLKQNYKNCDDYETTKNTWTSIINFIPKQLIIYEPFYLNGKSKEYLVELGLLNENIIHINRDFYEYYKKIKFDIIVSNPPFKNKRNMLEVLHKINKPFILMLPVSVITKKYFHNIFQNDIQILIPHSRVQFNQYDNDKKNIIKSNVYFDCIWICWKMKFENDITFLK